MNSPLERREARLRGLSVAGTFIGSAGPLGEAIHRLRAIHPHPSIHTSTMADVH
ncbi:hypothetical protein [Longimicrobium sp.]|uniref:hypothetical protein n=1 Tax=Longimicrobium sp. TaxID=2029185 RepID=UPI002E32F36E|nr:hypothetical protein [Longimicrobium sp.]HEX6042499.1 hypothetical protein [Longimicrobium sp.]